MPELDLDAEPQVIQLDLVYIVERGLEDLDCNIELDIDEGRYPSELAPRTYEKNRGQ